MYCSPEWSSSWHKDIVNNGEYLLDGEPVRQNDRWSTLWGKMKQRSRGTESRFFELLLSEIKLSSGLENINIMGGEPLLNNQLDQVLEHVHGKQINIVTGLGVNHERLRKVLQSTKDLDVTFSISAEATGRLFELIRYGVTWQDFQDRVNMIEENGNKIKFLSTISNLAVLGFNEFHETYAKRHDIHINHLSDTPWMMPHVLDRRSKDDFIANTKAKHNLPEFNTILGMINKAPTDRDRVNTGDYLRQFASRRSVTLDFLPAHFLKWCGIS
jgi:hypothetical protein